MKGLVDLAYPGRGFGDLSMSRAKLRSETHIVFRKIGVEPGNMRPIQLYGYASLDSLIDK